MSTTDNPTTSLNMNSVNHGRLSQRFDLIRKLGQGTYGKVQLGINKKSGLEVALKTIKKSKIETSTDLLRIKREISIMSCLNHPNILHIYEVYENKEKIILVMEYAPGGELYDYLSEKKKLEEDEAKRIFAQIASAIFYCHKHFIVHRDLKLENILLDENRNAKIGDFGLSNVYGDQLLKTFCGSPLYASPEIVRGTPYHGPEVDCWSLGVLLYTLVYGSMPFDGTHFKKLVKQITSGAFYEPNIRSTASELIHALLRVESKRRLTIEEIVAHDWLDGTDVHSISEEFVRKAPVSQDFIQAINKSDTLDEVSDISSSASAPPTTHPKPPRKPIKDEEGAIQPNSLPSNTTITKGKCEGPTNSLEVEKRGNEILKTSEPAKNEQNQTKSNVTSQAEVLAPTVSDKKTKGKSPEVQAEISALKTKPIQDARKDSTKPTPETKVDVVNPSVVKKGAPDIKKEVLKSQSEFKKSPPKVNAVLPQELTRTSADVNTSNAIIELKKDAAKTEPRAMETKNNVSAKKDTAQNSVSIKKEMVKAESPELKKQEPSACNFKPSSPTTIQRPTPVERRNSKVIAEKTAELIQILKEPGKGEVRKLSDTPPPPASKLSDIKKRFENGVLPKKPEDGSIGIGDILKRRQSIGSDNVDKEITVPIEPERTRTEVQSIIPIGLPPSPDINQSTMTRPPLKITLPKGQSPKPLSQSTAVISSPPITKQGAVKKIGSLISKVKSNEICSVGSTTAPASSPIRERVIPIQFEDDGIDSGLVGSCSDLISIPPLYSIFDRDSSRSFPSSSIGSPATSTISSPSYSRHNSIGNGIQKLDSTNIGGGKGTGGCGIMKSKREFIIPITIEARDDDDSSSISDVRTLRRKSSTPASSSTTSSSSRVYSNTRHLSSNLSSFSPDSTDLDDDFFDDDFPSTDELFSSLLQRVHGLRLQKTNFGWNPFEDFKRN